MTLPHIDTLPAKGMLLSVYTAKGHQNATRGPSQTRSAILVVGEGVPQVHCAYDRKGKQVLPVFALGESRRGYPVLVPADVLPGTPGEGMRVADGGNFAATSDGRWGDLIRTITGGSGAGIVPIHDRSETGGYGLRTLTGNLPSSKLRLLDLNA